MSVCVCCCIFLTVLQPLSCVWCIRREKKKKKARIKTLNIHLTEQTSVHIRDPQLPEVGQLTNHNVRQLLDELHLLRGFKAPGCNTEATREVRLRFTFCEEEGGWFQWAFGGVEAGGEWGWVGGGWRRRRGRRQKENKEQEKEDEEDQEEEEKDEKDEKDEEEEDEEELPGSAATLLSPAAAALH